MLLFTNKGTLAQIETSLKLVADEIIRFFRHKKMSENCPADKNVKTWVQNSENVRKFPFPDIFVLRPHRYFLTFFVLFSYLKKFIHFHLKLNFRAFCLKKVFSDI